MPENLFKIDEESLQNLTRTPNLGTKVPSTGYNYQATGFVCSQIAAKDNFGYVDSADILIHNNWDYLVDKVLESADKERIITGEIPVTPADNSYLALDYFMFAFAKILPSDDFPVSRVVIPLTIAQPDESTKETHGTALCLDNQPGNKLNIILLEQHAYRTGQNDYRQELDFSNETKAVLQHLQQSLKSESFNGIKLFENKKPICREQGVCGIVSLELCRELITTDSPARLALMPPSLSHEDVEAAHHKNYLSFSKNITPQLSRSNNR